MQNIEDCCVVYNQSIGKGVLIAFIKNKISSISYTKEEYRKQLAFFLPPAMIPSEFVNVERFPLSTNGKIDRKGLAESIQKNIKVKHNAKKYIIAFSEMASLCITKASELLGENIIINRIFLINPSKAKESDLYLGDISIIDGNSVAIKSWEKAVLGNVRESESNSNDIFDIIMRELENDK